MSVPTYGGIPIFGPSPVVTTKDLPRERQVNAFFGLNGVECLDGGSRGLETHATGVLWGVGELGLSAAFGRFRSFKDGTARLLINTLGEIWPNVILVGFGPKGRVRTTPRGERWSEYEALFVHLTD